jgi:hypothetical protein
MSSKLSASSTNPKYDPNPVIERPSIVPVGIDIGHALRHEESVVKVPEPVSGPDIVQSHVVVLALAGATCRAIEAIPASIAEINKVPNFIVRPNAGFDGKFS